MPAEDLNELQLPHDIKAEQAVLGAMLMDGKNIPKAMERLRPDDFFMRQNRDLFQVMFTMYNRFDPIDLVTLTDRMKQAGVYDERTTVHYLAQLMETTLSATLFENHVNIVADKAMLRRVSETLGELAEMVRAEAGTSDQILETAEQRIYALRQGKSQGMSHISAVMGEVFQSIKDMYESGGAFPGISTGLVDLDRKISGLNKSDLIILAARPGVGKSSLAMNIALEAAEKSGRSVAVFSLEMSREQLGMRLVSTKAQIDNKKLSTGRISGEDEWKRLALAVATLSQARMFIDDDASVTVAGINAKCRRVDDLGLVIVDYLQLVSSAGGPSRNNENRQQIVSDMSRSLKLMAKELNVPVICLSQLSRASENRAAGQRKPMLSDLRDSGAIEQDADIVLFIHRDSYYDEDSDSPNIAECIVAKNRHGETGSVKLEWRPEFTAFRSLTYRDDDEDL